MLILKQRLTILPIRLTEILVCGIKTIRRILCIIYGFIFGYIWIHLWPNAYKNDRTALSDQLLGNGRTDFYFSKEENKGYINRLNFKVDDEVAEIKGHPRHQDIVQLILPKPLAPGTSITIQTPFNVKIPHVFSRSGHVGNSFQLTQWYPKPAVYDKKGWHPMPYLDQGEFYSEFGNYNVVTVSLEIIM